MLAKDLATGEVLRCDVILDVIDKLDVLTTTRELYLEEAPETFELWAQDSQGKHKSQSSNAKRVEISDYFSLNLDLFFIDRKRFHNIGRC